LVTGATGTDTADVPVGAEMVRLDFTDPSTAAPAVAGADRVFVMRPPAISDVATALGPLVSAAAREGVRRVVALSVMGVNPALPHWRMESMISKAGLALTALRPAYFAQNLITAFGSGIRDRSELALASGNGKVSFVDTRDVAAVAAAIFTDLDRWPALPTTLTGPQALTFTTAAALLTAELGRPIHYRRQSLWQRRGALRAQGAENGYVNVQLVIDLTTRLGLAAKITQDIPRILGRPATTLAQFIHDHRSAWIPDR
jgi:uncharacterized protein YbjT (DUF2867 family)